MASFVPLLQTAAQWPIVAAALRLALVVGTLLNLINQGGALLDGLSLSWFHAALNYLVPYCVASYSAAGNELRRQERKPGDSSRPEHGR